jgi:hypothetical protein
MVCLNPCSVMFSTPICPSRPQEPTIALDDKLCDEEGSGPPSGRKGPEDSEDGGRKAPALPLLTPLPASSHQRVDVLTLTPIVPANLEPNARTPERLLEVNYAQRGIASHARRANPYARSRLFSFV